MRLVVQVQAVEQQQDQREAGTGPGDTRRGGAAEVAGGACEDPSRASQPLPHEQGLPRAEQAATGARTLLHSWSSGATSASMLSL